MAHEKLTQVQTIVFTLYEGYDVGAQSLRWTKISSWQYIGKQVPAARLNRIRLSRIRLSRTPRRSLTASSSMARALRSRTPSP